MTVEREPLPRWRYPSSSILQNEVFASGRPPFAPFPTEYNLVNAHLCPVALYHDLIHGLDSALYGSYVLQRREELFLKFAAYLKVALKNSLFELRGDIPSQLMSIQNEFFNFSRSIGFLWNESNDIWRQVVEPWTSRKLDEGELAEISSESQFYFELSLANPRIPFPLNRGRRTYPLRGQLAEINISRRQIIERTSAGRLSDETSPLLRDYKVWLLGRILTSLNRGQLSPSWRDANFRNFDLIVETPHHDFLIQDDPDFVPHTHWAYAWINDLSISETSGVFREVFENGQCDPVDIHQECMHPFRNCFPRRYPYPQSRPEIRQAFQPWYRLLLWEQIWDGCWHYQLTMLSRQELVNLGLIVETQIIGVQNNQVELEVTGRNANALRGYEYCTIIPFGTVHCGLKLDARIVRTYQNRVHIQIHDMVPFFQESALLLPSSDIPSPIFREPPIFLDRQIQQDLFRLKNIGVLSEEAAQRRSLIQLLEAIFGTRQLSRGS